MAKKKKFLNFLLRTAKFISTIIAALLAFVVLIGSWRTVFVPWYPFVQKLNSETQAAYITLGLAAILLFALARFGVFVNSVEIAGIKFELGQLGRKVDKIEEFFRSRCVEQFSADNWERVTLVSKSKDGVVLEVTLEREPIPSSVEVYEGVLLMPESEYQIDGRRLRFPANSEESDIGLKIAYHSRTGPL